MDSGCLRHMSGDPSKFSNWKLQNNCYVTFGDNNKGYVKDVGIIRSSYTMLTYDVLVVAWLKYNLLSANKLLDKVYQVTFYRNECSSSLDNEIRFVAECRKNICIISQNSLLSNEKLLISLKDESVLWHKRLSYANYQLLSKLAKKELVRGLPKISFWVEQLLRNMFTWTTNKSLF